MKNFRTLGSRLVGLALLGLLLWATPAAQAANIFVSNTNDSGAGSLRQAIINANATASLDTIIFDIPGAGVRTITPASQLPEITKPLIIDGTSQPGYSGTPLIELNGSLAGPTAHGLLITGGNSWVKGLAINRFKNVGIYLDNLGQNTVSGNYIGTNASGTGALGNNNGVVVNTPISTVGGTTIAARNIISGNKYDGVAIGNKATGSIVRGNHIGTNAAGTAALPNGSQGVYLTYAENILIGGVVPGARNVISGNGYYGLYMSESTSNTVQGNYIGTDASGSAPLGNAQGGVYLSASANNLIGGNVAAASNVISGNNSHGIGIRLGISVGNQIKGNFIGSEKTGTNPVPNSGYGILLREDVTGTRIGGLNAEDKNTIAFNGRGGILVESGIGNEILRNYIVVNHGLGIDLGDEGVLPNDANDTDSGANNLQNFPAVSSVSRDLSSTIFTGALNSKANTEYRIEFFYVGSPDLNGSCQGQYYLGTIPSLITNASGDANFNMTLPLVLAPVGQYVTATATDSSGNTSEFSPCTLITPKGAGTFSFGTAATSSSEMNGSALMEVKRTGGSSGAVSVNYAATNGTATSPADYTAMSGTLNFANGEVSKILAIPVINDTLDEADESFSVTLSNPTGGATLGSPNTTTYTIVDNDPTPTVSIGDVTIAEGNNGTLNALFPITLSAASGQSVTVNFATADGTATAGTDYEFKSGFNTFGPGETSRTIAVAIKGDPDVEPNETFSVNLTSVTNATLADSQGIGTIINDDGAPASNTVQFSQASYSVAEGAHFTTINVTRSGDTSGAASVDYATQDGSAQQRTDFTIALGTLSFAAGETSKSLTVLITDDSYVEGSETFSFTLSHPVGVTLGAQSTATLTIIDDAIEQPGNLNDEAAQFVRQQYHDFLNREPDAGGLQYWTGQITQCGANQACINTQRRAVSAAFFVENEYQQTGYFAYRFNKAAYGLSPTYAQFNADRSRISTDASQEASKQAFAVEFVKRAQFIAQYPLTLDAQAFVNALLLNVMQNSGVDLSGQYAALVDAYSNAGGGFAGRAAVLRAVADNAVFVQKEYNKAFVLTQYFGYLRRDPDAGGYLFWLGILDNGLPNNASGYNSMVCAFITSGEYQGRFSFIHTHTDNECAP